jgi:hypothetical protein
MGCEANKKRMRPQGTHRRDEVLTDEMVRQLVRAAQNIRRVFGDGDQDIEWIYMGWQLYIVQSRPFVPGA